MYIQEKNGEAAPKGRLRTELRVKNVEAKSMHLRPRKRGKNTHITEADDVACSSARRRHDAHEQNRGQHSISCCTQHAGSHYIKKLPHAVHGPNVAEKRVHFGDQSASATRNERQALGLLGGHPGAGMLSVPTP